MGHPVAVVKKMAANAEENLSLFFSSSLPFFPATFMIPGGTVHHHGPPPPRRHRLSLPRPSCLHIVRGAAADHRFPTEGLTQPRAGLFLSVFVSNPFWMASRSATDRHPRPRTSKASIDSTMSKQGPEWPEHLECVPPRIDTKQLQRCLGAVNSLGDYGWMYSLSLSPD